MRFFGISEWFWPVLEIQNGSQHRFLEVFLSCFFQARFGIEIRWIFGRWGPQKQQFYIVKTRLFTKSRFSENIWKNIDFRPLFGGQSDAKSIKKGVENYVFVLTSICWCFFRFLGDFWSPRGTQGTSKITKNATCVSTSRFGSAFFARLFFKAASGSHFDRFLVIFC